MNKFCSQCGTPIPQGAEFCPSCGAKLSAQVVHTPNHNEIKDSVYEQNDSLSTTQNQSMHLNNYVEDTGIGEMFFKTKGRLNRKRYVLRGCIISFIFMICTGIPSAMENTSLMAIGIILCIPLIISGTMLSIRRCHDLNHSGYYVLLMGTPVIGMIISLLLLFKKGTDGSNQYGPDPLGH